jgi:hypothetical protein
MDLQTDIEKEINDLFEDLLKSFIQKLTPENEHSSGKHLCLQIPHGCQANSGNLISFIIFRLQDRCGESARN